MLLPQRQRQQQQRHRRTTRRYYHNPASYIHSKSETPTTTLGRRCTILASFSTTTTKDSEWASSQSSEKGDGGTETIFALSSGGGSTSSGGGRYYQATALAVIRISGPLALSTLQKMRNSAAASPPPRKAMLCKLYQPLVQNDNNQQQQQQQERKVLDQALVLYFPSPNSFTGEDVVELHCHGSRAVVTDVLEVLSQLPHHRMAEPGEFTQRAFAAGKLDLMQVEALADLLTADTTRQRQQALTQLDGTLSAQYETWRKVLIKGLAHAEAVIDFGDDEALLEEDDDDWGDVVQEDTKQWNIWGGVQEQMNQLRKEMEFHLQDSRRGELVREGLRIAIVGPPNAGKSSLFNVLAQKDAAIVSNIAGTTRDVLELSLNLGGIKCVLSDTAGVRTSSNDIIEQEGIKRAKQVAQSADVVVAMVEQGDLQHGITILNSVLLREKDNEGEDEEESSSSSNNANSEEGMEGASGRLDPENVLLVLNKMDLKNENVEVDNDGIRSSSSKTGSSHTKTFEISCHTNEGIDSFLDALTQTVTRRVNGGGGDDDDDGNGSDAGGSSEGSLITRARHRQHVQAAVEALERFHIRSQQGTMVVDMAAEELRLAASELGRVTGAVDVEDILDVLFKDFCIGK